MKKGLSNVTLIGIDCIDLDRLKVAADICMKDFSFGAVKLLSSIEDADPRVVKIPSINSTVAYSEFCIKELWKYVDTDFALVFQYDGFILNPSAWDDNFLKYDYIGSPWYHLNHISVGMVGNGGFSLRSKKLLDFVGKNYGKIGGNIHPEDFWICDKARPYIEKEGMKFAPVDVASRFSMEGTQKFVVWNGQFGAHGLFRYTDISSWLDGHPEYKEVLKQNLNDFTKFMRKYPVYDGTVHVLKSKKIQVEDSKKIYLGEKNYDCRLDLDLEWLDEIRADHKIVYLPHRMSDEKAGFSTFERVVEKIEKFSSKKELLKKYPDVKITNSFKIPKWKQRLAKMFGNIVFPEKESYTLIWFENKV